MITKKFRKCIENSLGGAVIFAGSSGDKPHIDKIVKSLKKYNLPLEVRIASAHKQPERLIKFINLLKKIKSRPVWCRL